MALADRPTGLDAGRTPSGPTRARTAEEVSVSKLMASNHRDDRKRRLTPHLPEFRRRLEEDHRFRVAQVQALEEEASALGDQTNLNGEILVALRVAAIGALASIDAALERLTTGDYGRCLACRTSLATARLQALPMVELCLECHRATELRHR